MVASKKTIKTPPTGKFELSFGAEVVTGTASA
jgi:hypothetical protein